MKRINIHFDEDWLKRLNELVIKVNKSGQYWTGATRADLIRLAVGNLYKLPKPYFRTWEKELLEKSNKQGKKCQK